MKGAAIETHVPETGHGTPAYCLIGLIWMGFCWGSKLEFDIDCSIPLKRFIPRIAMEG